MRTCIVCAFCAFVLLCPFGLASESNLQHLSDLPFEAQSAISSQLGRHLPVYFAVSGKSGLNLANPAQQLTTRFTSKGVEFRRGRTLLWGFSLQAYGYEHALKSVGHSIPRVTANRVEFLRGSLTEWYTNGPLGLEQGFSIKSAPAKASGKPLTFVLSTWGSLQATAYDSYRRGISLASSTGTAQLRYGGLAAHDSRDTQLPVWIEMQGNKLLLRINDNAAQYPLTIDPVVQLAELSASDAQNGDEFGYSVSMDSNTIVVGAPFHAGGSNLGQGAVYVFSKPSSGWSNMTETAELTASDGAFGDVLGISVSISGTTVAAGASGVTGNEGAVYIFVEPQSGWQNMTQTAKLTASDGSSNAGLGTWLSLSGNTLVASGNGSV